MRILLTFAGIRDPFNPDEITEGQKSEGPVLTVLGEEPFDRLYIFSDRQVDSHARDLADEVKRRYSRIRSQIITLDLPDPTDYEAIFYQLSQHTRLVLDKHAKQKPRYFISTASGTPQMQTVWFLLARSGLFPATLLKVTPRRFLRDGERPVSEIRLSLAEFPKISPSEIDSLDLVSLKIQKEKLEAEREALFEGIEAEGIIGKSKSIKAALTTLMKAAPTDYSILILGEGGTGKELFAKVAHKRSKRSGGPFIPVNCAAIPGTLIESELFGHEKGAFTGATSAKKGKFELANWGTLFLDEVGDLSAEAQAKVLRALQEGEIEKIGASKVTKVDVRVIAATNKDVRKRVAEGTFREDLYYRLHVIPVHLPPLRERREDIPLLIEHFLNQAASAGSVSKRLSKKALRILVDSSWPGNVRQLKNVVDQMVVLSEGHTLTEDDIPREVLRSVNGDAVRSQTVLIPPGGIDFRKHLGELERAFYQKAIEVSGGNQTAAARLLRIQPHTFRKRARLKFGLGEIP